ncbi:hypothetical protein EYF80_028764 [Liparis tanakae]|uniref:Uncharacterized protein n=1 Tax=Liparis tanakae TaxID=230148 RepID=A0A4Z2H5K2_9TELE|nr:hypothetical protein EYF80_028764 [Liparis tanakae]
MGTLLHHRCLGHFGSQRVALHERAAEAYLCNCSDGCRSPEVRPARRPAPRGPGAPGRPALARLNSERRPENKLFFFAADN